MTDVKKNKALKSWQLLLIAVVFIIIGWVMDSPIGTLICVVGLAFILFSISTYVQESRNKKKSYKFK